MLNGQNDLPAPETRMQMEAWAVKLGVAEARGERLTTFLRELGCFFLLCQISSSRSNIQQ